MKRFYYPEWQENERDLDYDEKKKENRQPYVMLNMFESDRNCSIFLNFAYFTRFILILKRARSHSMWITVSNLFFFYSSILLIERNKWIFNQCKNSESIRICDEFQYFNGICDLGWRRQRQTNKKRGKKKREREMEYDLSQCSKT